MKQRRVGIYPGTFDPIHSGHLAFAREAMQVCNLDEVIFLPEEVPRGKQDVTDITHRIALITYAIEDIPRFKVMSATSKQFDVAQTLPELRSIHTDSTLTLTLTLLIGSDVAKSLPNWEGIETLVGEVSFAIGMRSMDSLDEIKSIAHQVGALYEIIQTPEAHMTSTHVRSGATQGSLFSPAMQKYAKKHQLYI